MRAQRMLENLGISPERLSEYPHQMSGGMRQRIMIGMGLILNPDLLIADEHTTALDVVVEAQFLDLLDDLRKQYNLSIILITHDLSVVSQVTEKIAVMYAGKIVEAGSTEAIIKDPKHPYTQGLIKALPGSLQPGTRLNQIPGMMPTLTDIPPGCAFHPRCEICMRPGRQPSACQPDSACAVYAGAFA